MEGFFSKAQTQSLERPDGKVLSCSACGLIKHAHSPKMKPTGMFKKRIMCIGEIPEEIEDIRNKHWQGASGKILRNTFAELGIDLFEDCINLNSVNCRASSEDGETKKPSTFQIECCRRSVIKYIQEYKPHIIFLFGSVAIQSVIGGRWKKELGTVSKWTGYTIPDQELQAFICPVFHPIYIRKEDKKELTMCWKNDLRHALTLLHQPSFPVYGEPNITYMEAKDLVDFRRMNLKTVAIDYETTGLKPHADGHEIVCMAIAVNENDVYTFMMPKEERLRKPVIEILENENIRKIGHNIKYEHAWTFNQLGVTIKNWWWDTMLAAHVLDNRQGITGLKFQTYVRFGVIDYSSQIQPFLEGSDPKDSNSPNQLQKYVKTKENALETLKYCAKDACHTYRLALLQKKEMEQYQLPF